MTTQINPYLNFNGNCREAMNFYQECFGGELTMQTVGESPMATQMSAAVQENILHASLTKDSLVLMASDMMGAGFVNGNNISLSLSCSTEEEINTFFSKLAAGGKVSDDLKKQFWGALFGSLTDQFGINWMVNYDYGINLMDKQD